MYGEANGRHKGGSTSHFMLNVKTNKQTYEQIVVLKNLFDNEIPQKVDKYMMLTANKMKKAEDYILALYEVWLKSHPSPEELRFYIKKCKNLSPTMIGGLITATWKSKVQIIHKERKGYVLTIMDNTNWGKEDKQAFSKSCEDKDLVSFLNESNKTLKKIARFIFNIFKNNKKLRTDIAIIFCNIIHVLRK